MTSDDALRLLQEHPRLSEDVPQEVIDQLDAVRRHLSEHPDPRCIPHVFDLFGDHMGWGTFQLFDQVLRHYTPEQLLPYLNAALESEHRGTRWWAAHWALEWPLPELLPALMQVVESPSDEDAHYFGLAALGEIYAATHNATIMAYLRDRAARETDSDLKELLDELLLRKRDGSDP